MSPFDLNGKTVGLTGGYGHLGAAMALGLCRFGARVVVLGRSQEKFQARFPGPPPGLSFSHCDVSDTNSVSNALTQLQQDHGSLDVLINNATYFHGNAPLGISDADWASSLEGGLGSAYRCIREAATLFAQQGHGNVINIASMYGMVSPDFRVYECAPGSFNPPHYGAAKAALIQLTKYYAQLLGDKQIRVNAISPGPFPNPEVQKNQEFIDQLAEHTSLGRIGDPEDLVGAVIFLSSDASRYVTGHNLVVDGGWTIT